MILLPRQSDTAKFSYVNRSWKTHSLFLFNPTTLSTTLRKTIFQIQIGNALSTQFYNSKYRVYVW